MEFTGGLKLNSESEKSYPPTPVGFLANGVCFISLMYFSHSPNYQYILTCIWPIFILASAFDSAVQ